MFLDQKKVRAHAFVILSILICMLTIVQSATYASGEVVDSNGDVGESPSIAVDSQGNPHIVYWDRTNRNCKYAMKSAGFWSIDTLDVDGSVGMWSSLVIDDMDNPHISYVRENTSLIYNTKSAGFWSPDTVKEGEYRFSSIALDSLGNPHISYFNASSEEDLEYASKTGDEWEFETVDSSGKVGRYSSLALDSLDVPHIAYYDETASNFDLKYANRSGGTWTSETVDGTGDVGAFCDLALDAEGNPHISYADRTNDDLRYAVKSGGSWTFETVDASGSVGMWTSITIDAQGNPHISYYDETNGDLKYATKSGGVWSTATLDNVGDVGLHTSIALDAGGNYHISYHDETNGDLKYITGSLQPVCEVAPTSIDFGTIPVGASAEDTVVITNTGGGLLSGDVTEMCDAYEVVSGAGPFSLAGGDTLEVVVRFQPGFEGAHVCSLQTGESLCSDVYLTGSGGPEPFVLSISDIGNDQGRWVRINFLPSSRDASGSTSPILQYEVFRRIDQSLMSEESGAMDKAVCDPMLSETSILLAGWEFVGAVPAHGETEYNIVAPTLADSTIAHGEYWSVFFVRAATMEPLTFFDSPIDSGYSLDNLSPAPPKSLVLSESAILSWDEAMESDFDYYSVYGVLNESVGGTGEPVLISATSATSFDVASKAYYDEYWVTATDFSGNEGEAASINRTAVGIDSKPFQSVFDVGAYPNPFNPSTTIRISLPSSGAVNLSVYDASGRLIRTLVNGMKPAGEFTLTWDGSSLNGSAVSSGVYFLKLKSQGKFKTHKVVLLK